MIKPLLITTALLSTSCYVPLDTTELTTRLEGLEDCEWERSWTCIEESEVPLDPTDYTFCFGWLQSADVTDATPAELCDFNRCHYLLSWSAYTYDINVSCYETTCASTWYARAALDLCTQQVNQEFSARGLNCIQYAKCGQWYACHRDTTSEERTQLLLDINACALRTRDYLIDQYR